MPELLEFSYLHHGLLSASLYRGPGAGFEVMASTTEILKALKTFLPAVVGGTRDIFNGAIHAPNAPEVPLLNFQLRTPRSQN